MARINVNPTRMELKKLKARLKTATRGHKLLKEKTDEMVRRFSSMLKVNKVLREQVEGDVSLVLKQFGIARAFHSKEEIDIAFSMPSASIDLICKTKTVMNVLVPSLVIKDDKDSRTDGFPYSFIGITSQADYSVAMVSKLILNLVRLAETEKTVQMLADEIEKSKRRVNALEYVMIPDLEETIKYITMKLEENERGNQTRLMKVKEMMND